MRRNTLRRPVEIRRPSHRRFAGISCHRYSAGSVDDLIDLFRRHVARTGSFGRNHKCRKVYTFCSQTTTMLFLFLDCHLFPFLSGYSTLKFMKMNAENYDGAGVNARFF